MRIGDPDFLEGFNELIFADMQKTDELRDKYPECFPRRW